MEGQLDRGQQHESIKAQAHPFCPEARARPTLVADQILLGHPAGDCVLHSICTRLGAGKQASIEVGPE